MKKTLNIISLTLIISGFFLVFSQSAHAQTASSIASMFGMDFSTLVSEALANIVNTFLQITSWFLAMAGFILNFSINLTLHIKEFLAGTPAVYEVWRIIRDISGMFLIFALLYAAMMLITGLGDAKFGNLIKNIVVLGILINFSFFITGLGIDVSNIVSIQLYNAIAPANSLSLNNLDPSNIRTTKTSSGEVANFWNDGGLSDIFMKSLKITSLYNVGGQVSAAGKDAQNNSWASPVKIILIGMTSIVIMITAAFSFILAALAFLLRFVILIFLLAFSPFWFASFVIPEVGQYGKEWTGRYKNQLIFMPVYLLLMYMALKVLTESKFFSNPNSINVNGPWYLSFLALGMNAAIVILMLNMPLFAALAFGAVSNKAMGKYGAGAIWSKIGGWGKSMIGTAGVQTAGRFAGKLNEGLESTRYAGLRNFSNSVFGRDIRAGTLGALARNKMGSERSYEEFRKENKEAKKAGIEGEKKMKQTDRTRELERLVNNKINDSAKFKDLLSAMSDKERQELSPDLLKNEFVVRHLKKEDFDAIKKSDDISQPDKDKIKSLRFEAVQNMAKEEDIKKVDNDALKNLLRGMTPEDILEKVGKKALLSDNVIAHLSVAQLKSLAEQDLTDEDKRTIGDRIMNWQAIRNKNHPAFGFIRKNWREWTNGLPEPEPAPEEDENDENEGGGVI